MKQLRNPSFIIFRCDDFRNSEGFIAEVENTIVNTFVRNKLNLVISAIPRDLESAPERINYLKPYISSGSIEIALHGWSHIPLTELLSSKGIKSEFLGRPYDDQLSCIANGKRQIEEWFEQQCQCFVPPWNNYDITTLRACSEIGIKILSADIYGPSSTTYPNIALLPGTTMLHSLERLIKDCETNERPGRVAVVLFHPYEFYESKSGLASFSFQKFYQILEHIAHSPNIICLGFCEALEAFGSDLNNYRYNLAQEVDRSAAKIYQNRWLTRLGNHLHILLPMDITGYETRTVYTRRLFQQRLFLNFPLVLLILAIMITIVVSLAIK